MKLKQLEKTFKNLGYNTEKDGKDLWVWDKYETQNFDIEEILYESGLRWETINDGRATRFVCWRN